MICSNAGVVPLLATAIWKRSTEPAITGFTAVTVVLVSAMTGSPTVIVLATAVAETVVVGAAGFV